MATKKIIMHFENCYGIHALDYDFDFAKTKSYAIYAQNGTMKTSLAKTLIDYTKNKKPDNILFPDIAPKLSIIDENEDKIEPESIFVIKSEVNDFSTEKMSTLLVNKELRERHLSITKQIDDVKKFLIDNGFFKAKHKVAINTRTGIKTIETENDLKTAIEEEKSLILNNDDLKKSFESFSKTLQKNEDTRKLAKYLEENPNIIEHLNDRKNFKKNIWASFIKEIEPVYNNVIKINSQVQPELEKIREQAMKESSKWEYVVKIFKDRFSVPFEITIDNKTDVILEGEATVPVLSFKYIDQHTSAISFQTKDSLYKTLSRGEQRALYILDIIFEIEARKELKIKTLFIFDDIADSFDYKNKYAIIQYLYELQSYPDSYQIILTHNFDFFRTIVSRLNIEREYALYPKITTSGKIILKKMPYQKEPFKVWGQELNKNKTKLIASIPFMRNITEYCSMEEEHKKLTALLHINPEIFPYTNDITIKDLEKIIKVILKRNDEKFTLSSNNQFNHNDKVKDIIYQTADSISQESEDNYLLENKIVLSIAIRLKTEEFMLNSLKAKKKI